MITKKQALTCTSFIQVSAYTGEVSHHNGTAGLLRPTVQLVQPMRWRANGKTKTFKRACNSHKFSVPIKHGLYSYGYITEENAHLFEVVS